MAHIGVELRDSPWGQDLARLEPPGADASPVLPDFENLDFPLLRLIDPYGTTYFNSYQMSGVLNELHRFQTPAGPVRSQLIELAETCRRTNHSYLTFLED